MHKPLHTEFDALLRRACVMQTEFAVMCGVTTKAVNNWCRGRQAVPRWAWVIAHVMDQVDVYAQPTFRWDQTLGVCPPLTLAKAMRARAVLAKQYHPDIGGDVQAMQRINAALDAAKKELSS